MFGLGFFSFQFRSGRFYKVELDRGLMEGDREKNLFFEKKRLFKSSDFREMKKYQT